MLLPYVEQTELYEATIDIDSQPWAQTWLDGAFGMGVSTYLCPSDGMGGQIYWIDPAFQSRAGYPAEGPNKVYRSKFLGFFSGLNDGRLRNHHWDRPEPVDFRHAFRARFGRQIGHITDGTSSTMVMAEYLTGSRNHSARGAPFSTRAGNQNMFPTLTPNSTLPDNLYWGSFPDGVLCMENEDGLDGMPCVVDMTDANNFISPRSRCPGGV